MPSTRAPNRVIFATAGLSGALAIKARQLRQTASAIRVPQTTPWEIGIDLR
ncbi:MAG: hypothetical protein AAFV72_01345 [Cyanobacteria bacterium J06635_1]